MIWSAFKNGDRSENGGVIIFFLIVGQKGDLDIFGDLGKNCRFDDLCIYHKKIDQSL